MTNKVNKIYKYRVPSEQIQPQMILAQNINDRTTDGKKFEWLAEGYIFKSHSLPAIIHHLNELGILSLEVYSHFIHGLANPIRVEIPAKLFKYDKKNIIIEDKIKKMKQILVDKTEEKFKEIHLLQDKVYSKVNIAMFETTIHNLYDDPDFDRYLRIFVEYSKNNYILIQHSINVFFYSLLLCSSGKTKNRLVWKKIGACALLHDIGYNDKRIRPHWFDNSPFSDNRKFMTEITNHMKRCKQLLKNRIDTELFDIIYKHHSYLDGSGYPRLDLIHIPFLSQILSVADLYDIHLFYMSKNEGNRKDKIKEYRNYLQNRLKHKINIRYYYKLLAIT